MRAVRAACGARTGRDIDIHLHRPFLRAVPSPNENIKCPSLPRLGHFSLRGGAGHQAADLFSSPMVGAPRRENGLDSLRADLTVKVSEPRQSERVVVPGAGEIRVVARVALGGVVASVLHDAAPVRVYARPVQKHQGRQTSG